MVLNSTTYSTSIRNPANLKLSFGSTIPKMSAKGFLEPHFSHLPRRVRPRQQSRSGVPSATLKVSAHQDRDDLPHRTHNETARLVSPLLQVSAESSPASSSIDPPHQPEREETHEEEARISPDLSPVIKDPTNAFNRRRPSLNSPTSLQLRLAIGHAISKDALRSLPEPSRMATSTATDPNSINVVHAVPVLTPPITTPLGQNLPRRHRRRVPRAEEEGGERKTLGDISVAEAMGVRDKQENKEEGTTYVPGRDGLFFALLDLGRAVGHMSVECAYGTMGSTFSGLWRLVL